MAWFDELDTHNGTLPPVAVNLDFQCATVRLHGTNPKNNFTP